MKKSIVISLLTVTTLFCTALCSFASTGKVTTDTLRLRKEASKDSSTIALLSINDKVEILGEENGWYKVQFGEKIGYVAAQYINVLTEVNTKNENEDQNQNSENTTNTNAGDKENQTEGETAGVTEEIKVLVTGDKIYITPLINSLAIEELKEEKQIEIVSEINGWSYITLGTISGWVRTETIKQKEVVNNTSNTVNNNTSSQKVGYISGTSVNFRKTPNTSGEIISKLTRNAKVTVLAKDEGWAKIEYNGDTGYVSIEYLSDTEIQTTSRGSINRVANSETAKTEKSVSNATEKVTSATATGSDVVNFAKQYLGAKYKSGGSTPSSGFDCSGFTTFVYKHFGISVSRTSKGQSSNGVKVEKANLAVGDIICFSSSSASKNIGHVGIYIGGGKFIHSANSRKGVIISNVAGDGYYFVTARRVV